MGCVCQDPPEPPTPVSIYSSVCGVRKAEVFLSFGKPCFPSTLLTQKTLQQRQCVCCHSRSQLRNNTPCNSTAGTGAWGCWAAPPSTGSKDHVCQCPCHRRGCRPCPRTIPFRPALMICLECSMSIHVPSIPTLDRVVRLSARRLVSLRIQCLPGSPGSKNLHPRAVLFKTGPGVHTHFSLSRVSARGALIPTAQDASHQLLSPPCSIRDAGDSSHFLSCRCEALSVLNHAAV